MAARIGGGGSTYVTRGLTSAAIRRGRAPANQDAALAILVRTRHAPTARNRQITDVQWDAARDGAPKTKITLE
eukprot:3942809-Lingulodinium_polyedra.AAC.1